MFPEITHVSENPSIKKSYMEKKKDKWSKDNYHMEVFHVDSFGSPMCKASFHPYHLNQTAPNE